MNEIIKRINDLSKELALMCYIAVDCSDLNVFINECMEYEINNSLIEFILNNVVVDY